MARPADLAPTYGAVTPTAAAPMAVGADGDTGATSPAVETLRFVVAWAVAIMVLSLINRSRIGHAFLYYALVLMLFLLLVTQYRWFANVLEPITGKGADVYAAPAQAPEAHSWNVPQLAQSPIASS